VLNQIGVFKRQLKKELMSENQPTPPIQVSANETRTWNMFCHLSALAGFVFPFGNILGPLFIWERKKKQIPSVDVHGKSSLNFQITFSFLFIISCLIAQRVGYLFYPVLILVWICCFIFPIVGAVKANKDKNYKYPLSFKFFK
jgi:uncharacterized Tic20 family protein